MKKVNYIFISMISLLIFNTKVNASASISTNKSSVYSGESFNVSASISGAATWDVHVSATGPVSGCSISQAGYTNDLSETNKTFSVNCSTTGNGKIKLILSGTITDGKGKTTKISGSKNVDVISKPVSPAQESKPTTNNSSSKNSKNNNNSTKNESQSKKSDNNDLKKLEVEGFKLDKDFNKNSTEYSVNVSNETKKIKITAEKDSDKSKIIGDGEKEVKEGENKFEVIVTSESGKEKKYIVNVIVDSKPIKVTVDNKEYTIVKKKEDLPELNIEHDDLTLTIEDQEVPAYRIDKISYVLIGLRDNEGKINLFKFVSFKDSNEPYQYTLYNEIKFNQLSIVIKDFPKSKIPSNYKLYKETINDKKINVYKLSKNSNYSLIYGINIETGKENIYKYDKQENTIQTFEREEQEKLEKGTEQYKKLIIILVVVIIFLILLLTIALTKAFTKNKNKKANDELTKKDIKKIEKETKRMKKKNKEKEAEL